MLTVFCSASRNESSRSAYISSSQPQQHPTGNGFLEQSRDSPSSQLMDDLSRSHNSEESVNGTPENLAVLIDGKAHEARQALHDLHSRGYKFNQIVEKGLNPAVLKELFTVTGIPFASSPPAQQQVGSSKAGDSEMTGAAVAVTAGIDNTGGSLQSRDKSYIAKPSDKKKPLQSKDINNTTTLPLVTTANDKQSSSTVAKLAKGVPGKGQGVKAGDSKVVDRKEYIARMLAAKTGKPASSAGTPLNSKASTSTTSNPDIQNRTLPAPSPHDPATAPPVTQATPDPKASSLSRLNEGVVEAEAKRKAQTDLARQKIEALKIRESKLHEARTEASKESKGQIQQPLSAPPTQGLFERSGTALQSTVPSRQGSYFSPTSQKPPFSIPGLFMTSDVLQSPKYSQQMGSQASEPSQQTDTETETVIPVVQQQSYSNSSPSPIPALATGQPLSLASHTVDIVVPTSPPDHDTRVVPHRKRQKAADFIDSPSTRVKRPLGQQEHSSVIIDISEDDDSSLAGENLDVELEHEQSGLPPQPRSSGLRNEAQKSFRELPPLTEIPSWKKAAISTPPTTQTSAHNKDSEGLKTKEMEIEQMNRKIKELEQRISAKKTTSRAQTPSASGNTLISSPVSHSSQKVMEQPSSTIGITRVADQSTAASPARHSSLPAVETTDSATEEQLVAEQQLHEVELAKAEAECELAADTIRASQEHRRTEEGTSPGLQQDGQQRPTENDLQRTPEVTTISSVEADDRQRRQQLDLAEDDKRHLQEEQRRRLRKTEIESDLPAIDAAVERTREKLQNLHKEVEDLEKQVQKAVEDKKVLLEELLRLSQTTAILDMPMDLPLPAPNSLNPEEIMNEGKSPGALGDGELEEDTMDISRSDIDEGEIAQSGQGSTAETQRDSSMIDDEESYEPPSDIVPHQHSLNESQSKGEFEKGDIEMQDDDASIDNGTTKHSTKVRRSTSRNSTNATVQHDEQLPQLSPSLAGTSDDDDYEPPEPSSFAEDTALPVPVPVHDSKAYLPPAEAESDGVAAPIQSKSQAVSAVLPNEPQDATSAAKSLEVGRHTIDPETPVCQYELGGICNDDSCKSQHLKSMGLSDEKILVDLGSAPDGLSREEAEAFTNSLRELIQDIRSRRIKDVNVVAREITAHRATFLGDQSKVLPL
ncbi:hypothetical protein P7C71_g224, partial [Lecanoromycetidae sp. Uapishka_2]